MQSTYTNFVTSRNFGTSSDDPGLEILTDQIQFSDVVSQVCSLQYLAF